MGDPCGRPPQPPLCKGRWHPACYARWMTEGLFRPVSRRAARVSLQQRNSRPRMGVYLSFAFAFSPSPVSCADILPRWGKNKTVRQIRSLYEFAARFSFTALFYRRAGTSRRPYADTSDPFVGAGVLDGPHSAQRCHGFAQRRISPRLSCLPLRGRWIRAFHSPDPKGEAFERVSDPSKTPRGLLPSGRCIISLYQPREVNCLLPYQNDHTLAIKMLLFFSWHGIMDLRRNSIISKQGMVFTIGKNAFSIFAFPVWMYKNCVAAKELCVFRA